MTATIPPPYTMLLDSQRAGATTSHMLDALVFSAAANATEFSSGNWDHLLERAHDRVFGAAATAAMDETAPLGVDIWDGVTYDDLPDVAVAGVLTSALYVACRFCDHTDERGTPLAELLSDGGAADQRVTVTPALPDDTERVDLIEFVQKEGRTLLVPSAGAQIFRVMHQIKKLAADHPGHTVSWAFMHPATGEVLSAYDLSAKS
ncbi:hypothetical protein HII36_05220 [Nonomuraea sp. NN258]|uniref:hypothetical protein n=1 Tax=Nonomuraea antri TaxID=2730852 RepID=UPI001569BC4E|nr:hypothetical protein [Nonomuraea antri]NRQ31237.1 hypothetical protein [Nonomuraea antri]